MAEAIEAAVGEALARFRYPDAKVFREFMEALGKIVEEAKFTITEDGVKVMGMDPARVALIEVLMPRDAFLEFEVNAESADMGIGMDVLLNAVKRGKKGDPVEFTVSQDKVLIKVESQAGAVKKYLAPNIEVLTELPGELRLEHDVEASVLSDALKRAVREAETVGEVMVFEAEEGELRLKGYTEGKARMELKLREGSPALIFLEVKNPATSAYDIGHLKNVLSLTKVAAAVDVKFSSDKPLELVFKSTEGSRVRFLLAPTSI